jgi:fucose permease
MARRSETAAVFSAGTIQGVALVTFPAASAIFVSPNYYGFSSTVYGGMFVPQAITATTASLVGGSLTGRWGIKRTYLLGLVANLVSMSLLVVSQFFMSNQRLAYGILLLATASLGVGFGLTVPSLNTFAAAFFPQAVNRAVLMLNALLGLGTALAPVFVLIFVGLGIWWGLPVLVAALLAVLLLFSARRPLQALRTTAPDRQAGLPARFWIFAAFALLYGVVETMNGNWATLYMTTNLAASTTVASLALTAFWVTVTVGRVLFAAVEKQFPASRTYHVLPFVAAIAFATLTVLPAGALALGVLTFGLAGLGCSALLPLTISFGHRELTAMVASVAGGLIAFYQLGYGLAAFGVGPLEELSGLSLSAIYGLAALVALAMAAMSFVVVGRGSASVATAGVKR